MLYLREAAPHSIETDLARRWHSLPLPLMLPLSDGTTCRLLYAGRPGGPQGPDTRDAVLVFPPGQQTRGDVEFHIRCSDWYAHQHHRDARYTNVILHVVQVYDTPRPVVRQDGQIVPVCSLNDVVPEAHPSPQASYPCASIMPAMTAGQRDALLQEAGLERFEQKTWHFLNLLRDARPYEAFSAYDTRLIPALAEALGYGRDRAFFRAAGLRLVGLVNDDDLPEPAGRAPSPSPLDAGRLRALGEAVQRWRSDGVWITIRRLLKGDVRSPAYADNHQSMMMHDLRSIFSGISMTRADIVICNVVLPFTAAAAALENDHALYARARQVYLAYPGLASNQVTRAMRKQLRLEREPERACQQQGLHYIYAQACQEKRCGDCPVTCWGLKP
jgi:Protein of unknown function (DUF2851)